MPPTQARIIAPGTPATSRLGRFSRALALAAMAGPASGCSLLFTEGPPAEHANLKYFDCSSDFAGPGADAIYAGLMVTQALVAATSSDDDWARLNRNGSRTANTVAPLVVAGLAVGSAAIGFTKVRNCQAAKEEWKTRIFAVPKTPRPGELPSIHPPGAAPGTVAPTPAVPAGTQPAPPLAPPPRPPIATPPPPVAPPMGPPPGATTPFSPPPGAPTAAPPASVVPDQPSAPAEKKPEPEKPPPPPQK